MTALIVILGILLLLTVLTDGFAKGQSSPTSGAAILLVILFIFLILGLIAGGL